MTITTTETVYLSEQEIKKILIKHILGEEIRDNPRVSFILDARNESIESVKIEYITSRKVVTLKAKTYDRQHIKTSKF